MADNWHRVSSLEELKSKKAKFIEINNDELAVFFSNGHLYAVNNFCPHRGGPLSEGEITENQSVICPLHGWSFDLKTGECLNMPNAKVETYPIEIRGKDIFVKL